MSPITTRCWVATVFMPVLVLLPANRGVTAQTPDMRMVIATSVACRSDPDRSSPVIAGLRLGEIVWISASRGVQGETWTARDGRTCWFLESLTAPLIGYESPDSALLAVADHALKSETSATFEHFVAVDNLLAERRLRRPPFARSPATLPAILELRHLQIIQAAAGAAGDHWALVKQPLRMAWVLGHADRVVHFEPGARYHVPAARFWELFERHRTASDAEQIAWIAATTPVYTDECYADCVLLILANSYARYWRAFPQGFHVAESLAVAQQRAKYAAGFCRTVSSGELMLGQDLSPVIEDLRTSLDAVAASGKEQLRALLMEIERTCRRTN